MKKAFFIGILSSFFFAFTFVMNRSMNLTGGYWIWSASLRYIFSLPILLAIVCFQKRFAPVMEAIKKQPVAWICWSTVGFGLFYSTMAWAADFGESWMIVSLWQLTIVAGVFLNPLWGKPIPLKSLGAVSVILLGVLLMQWEHIVAVNNSSGAAFSTFLMVISAVAYPLGNRKMMSLCEDDLDTPQRVLGMTICSLPFWLVLSIYAIFTHGVPSQSQTLQSIVVAVLSGVIATILFFKATNMVRNDPKQLSMVEGTISGEIVFTLLLGLLVLKDPIPSPLQFFGILLIIIGMLLNCYVAALETKK